jgi:PD-(D/E)XK nuclease superfamily protein
MRQLMNREELERFFANVGSLMTREERSSQLPDWKHLKHFFVSISRRVAIAEEKQRQLDRKKATRFNVFNLIQPDENKLSDILRDLLDPNGDHGQGDLFLTLFFKQLRIAADAKLMKRATVHREAPTQGILKYLRRMDVLVEAGMLKVAIENKMDSNEQPEQVKDYLEHLRYCTRFRPARTVLIYLTPDGRPAESISREVLDREVAGNKLCCWSYRGQLRTWLVQCRTKCKAPRIRHFISDFVRYIDLLLKEEAETEREQEHREH